MNKASPHWRIFEGSPREWDRIAIEHGSVFHSDRFLRILEGSQPGTLLRLGLFSEAHLVGILPIFVRRSFPVRVGASPMVVEDTPYLGIACTPGYLEQALRDLLLFARVQRIQFLRLMQATRLPDAVVPRSFEIIEKTTHVLDLRPPVDDLFKGMEGRCRTAIRKAQKSGIEVVRENDSAAVTRYFSILQTLYESQGFVVPNPLSFYQAINREFTDSELLFLSANLNGEMIAGAIVLCSAGNAFYLSGASRHEYNHLSPNNLVQWTAILAAKEAGAHSYDFVGSDIERLAKFKKSFGGSLVSYSCLEYSSAAWVSALREQYPKVKECFRWTRLKFSEFTRRSASYNGEPG